jgi:hypothetical protein
LIDVVSQIQRQKSDLRKRVTREFIELANFDFSELDLRGSWLQFQRLLRDHCRLLVSGRPDHSGLDRRRVPEDIIWVQSVVRRALPSLVREGHPPKLTLKEMMDHAEHVFFSWTYAIEGPPRKYTVASEYHDLIFWEVLEVDWGRVKKCGCGCDLYFWDNARNRTGKHFPGHGARVRKRRERAKHVTV